jgi:hypothetical protein
LGETVVRGQKTLHLFFRGCNNFGHHGGERERPLNIYFFEVVIILGETEVRGPDHSTSIFSSSLLFWASGWWEGQTTLHLFFRGRNNYFWRDETTTFCS